MRDFSKILPQGLTVEEAAQHPLNVVMFDISDAFKSVVGACCHLM